MRQDEEWPDISFSTWNQDDIGMPTTTSDMNNILMVAIGALLDQFYFKQINYHVQAAQPVHATLIRRIGAEGTTFLKNTNGALPLSNSIASIGVFGNDAGPVPESSCGTFGACSAGALAVG